MEKFVRVLASVATLLAMGLVWLGAPAPSRADPLVLHLPDMTVSVTSFDYQRGNMLITGIPSSGLAVGTTLETYVQSNMSNLLGTNNLPIPGLGLNSTYELTQVARFTEVVTSLIPTANGAIATFAVNPVQTNPFFELWFHNGILADNFNGTGFNTGTKILSGVIKTINSSVFQSTFSPTVLIDNPNTSGGTVAGKAFWNGATFGGVGPGTQTITGSGGATENLLTMTMNSVVLNTNSANQAFFLPGQTVTNYALTPDLNLEYKKVDPSKFFSGNANGVAPATVASIPQNSINGFGSANGGSDREVFEIHNSESFTVAPSATAVPEPASLALLTTGALGLLGYGWRRWKQAA
jgi:hypothetical protein